MRGLLFFGNFVGDQMSGIRDQGSGIRDQGSGIRCQGSGIRDQGSGIRRSYRRLCRREDVGGAWFCVLPWAKRP
ncbi:MAG: hypothetical protein LBI62_08170 [Candidatus Accumulibacter sp.]|nr:hypothetical protein [Accumulibacter sp.]